MQTRSGGKRRTIAAFASRAVTRHPALYTHMLVEDVSVGLMGFRFGENMGDRRVEIESDDAGKVGLEAILSSLSENPGYAIADLVQSTIEAVGTRLAWYGKAIYEICEAGTDTSLASISPYHLFRVPGGFIQLVPRKERQWMDNRRRYIFLPSSSAWVVQIPHELGGARLYRRMLDKLTNVSEPAPEFWTRELKAGKINTEFNVSDYNRRRDAYIARLTRFWGWNRRDSSGTYTTEFFYFFRSLRFRKAQAILRGHIVDELNRFLVSKGINARIQLKGYPSAEQIESLIQRALAGSLNYVEAWQQAR